MTKRKFVELLRCVPAGSKLFIEVDGPFIYRRTWYIYVRSAVPCFPSVLRRGGVEVRKFLDTSLSREKATVKADRYLRWLQER